jgi:hypothetical protein
MVHHVMLIKQTSHPAHILNALPAVVVLASSQMNRLQS